MIFRQLFDVSSSTYTYLLADAETKEAVLIDPVKEQVARDLKLLADLGLRLSWVLETHVHADHVTAAAALRARTGARVGYSAAAGVEGADVLLQTGDEIAAGKVSLEARQTPGHTNGCMSFVLADQSRVFTGDTLLIRGCGRTDFQQGSATTLYASVHEQLFSLPDDCAVYPGHDYKGFTSSTIGEERALNPRLGGGKTEAAFVEIMENLDLAHPKKIDIAVPANLRLGGPVEGEPAAAVDPFAAVERSPTGVPEVSPAWVADHLAIGRLVDVREPKELEGELCFIEGIENVPLATVTEAAKAWDKSEPVVVICRSGGRSGKAALELEGLGFAKVVSMAGGMLRWNDEDRMVACRNAA